jgi:hypothetical protein
LTVRQMRDCELVTARAKYSVRMETGANIVSECRSPAGTHTPACGGTIQLAFPVSTRMTPDAAYVN